MKKTFIIITLAGIFTACEKNKLASKIEESPGDNARVKIGYFTAWRANLGVQAKVDTVRITSVFTYAQAYPGGGFNTLGNNYADYLSVSSKPDTKISISVPFAGTNRDSLVVFSGTFDLEEGKRQTIMLTDTVPNVKATVVVDETPPSDPRKAKFKFFNGIPNVGVNLDIYAGSTKLASDIAYTKVSDYVELAITPGASLAFAAVKTGTTPGGSNTVATYSTTGMQNGRTYTILTRGFAGLTSSDPRRMMVSLVPTY